MDIVPVYMRLQQDLGKMPLAVRRVLPNLSVDSCKKDP